MLNLKSIEKSISEAILLNETIGEKKDAIKQELKRLSLENFDFSKYIFWEEGTYTRNAVIHTDDFSMLLLCWSKGCKSAIHDHPCDGCFIVGIQGELEETKYVKCKDTNALKETSKVNVKKGDITWMHDYLGFHKVSNLSETEGAITLHIYHPPFNVCKGYDVKGENWTCYPTFYSIHGEKIERKESK